jgi:hypothetical protein
MPFAVLQVIYDISCLSVFSKDFRVRYSVAQARSPLEAGKILPGWLRGNLKCASQVITKYVTGARRRHWSRGQAI